MTPKVLTKEITWLKNALADKSLPFGVDLAIPQIGGNARKTNHDYTHGHLPELIDIIVAEKVKLFICAVGVPPQWAVDKLHAGGVVIANMVGSSREMVSRIMKDLTIGEYIDTRQKQIVIQKKLPEAW